MLLLISVRKVNALKFGVSNRPFRQQGAALPFTLILLLVMTLIAIATLRTTTLEENMSANSRLRQIAFNAGESALVEAEKVVRSLRGQRRRSLFFGMERDPLDQTVVNGADPLDIIAPDPSIENKGDTCVDGFCTPAKYTSRATASTPPLFERWEDPNLDVWNTAGRHIEYANFANSGLANEGVVTPPQYIIEFLGNFDSKPLNVNLGSDPTARPRFTGRYFGNCRDTNTNALIPPSNVWPYCASDPAVYRITVRATAGPPARQAVVFMQSTLQVPF